MADGLKSRSKTEVMMQKKNTTSKKSRNATYTPKD